MSTTHTAYATCERCQETASLNNDVPYPHNYPEGWVEGLYDATEQRTYTWCCETCSRILLGPPLRLSPDGRVVSSITAIDYVCPFCLSHATAPFCGRCNGIVHFAYFPLSEGEREVLERRDGLREADEATLVEMRRRGIVDSTGQVKPLGASLQVLLLASPQQDNQ